MPLWFPSNTICTYHILQRELRSLSHNLAIHSNQRTTIIIQSVTITALLICIQVYTTKFLSGFLDEIDSRVQLAKFVMTTTGVCKYFNTIQTHANMWALYHSLALSMRFENDKSKSFSLPLRCKQLFACFTANTGISSADNCITKRNSLLTSNFLYHTRQIVVLDLSLLHPWGKVSQFSVVSIVSEEHLGPNQKNFTIKYDDTAIVFYSLVHDGPDHRN